MSSNIHRPRIFLGSASESAYILDVLVELLGYSVDCTSWQYADQLSLGIMENLEQLRRSMTSRQCCLALRMTLRKGT